MAPIPARRLAVAVAIVGLACGCGAGRGHGSWPLPNGDLAGTRAAAGSSIDRQNVARLRPRWRFRFTAKPSFSGIFASTPVADRDTVYVQDLRSNVFALDRSTGALRWSRPYHARNDGPNGLAVGDGRVYGGTDDAAFALSASTGKEIWRRHLTSGGGGLWDPVSIDSRGRLYGGNSNSAPWGGTRKRPNGGAFPGPALYTDSLLVLDARSGRLLWHDQVTPHDVRDYDFEATPIIVGARVIGAGKAGRVIAWNRETRRRLWTTIVGVHRNDVGPLPRRRVTVCPGLLGGVETPMAYADGRVFVPVVDLCGWGSATGRQLLTELDPARGTGRLVALDAATGRRLWERRFPSPNFGCATVSNDVVFTATYDGTVYALGVRDGAILWRAHMQAGVNACPAIAGELLLVGAGVRLPHDARTVTELVAFG